MGKGANPQQDKHKKKKPEQIGESRMQQTFNVQGSKDHDDLKRKREEYAVNLRKKKKYSLHFNCNNLTQFLSIGMRCLSRREHLWVSHHPCRVRNSRITIKCGTVQ